jgi:predicted phage-related endonuclease
VFELWHRKKNRDIVSIEQTDRMKWGSRLERTIAEGIAADQGWTVSAFKDYVRLPELMAGSSFDYKIGEDGLLEIKNVSDMAFKSSWSGDDDNLEAPPHIELQVQHQLMVSGCAYAYIGALVGGNSIKLIRRDPQPEIFKQIEKKIREFWATIERNEMPAPNFEKDAEFIKKLYSHAEPGLIIEEPAADYQDLVFKYRDIGQEIKKKESERAAIKSQLLMMIGEHEKVKGPGWTISAGMVGPTHVEFERKGFRDFRINYKKDVNNE